MNVEIRNFQSIEHVTLRIDGFTALVGRSNIGKSAVIRAIHSALSGASGTNFVRHGAACPRRVKKAKTCKCHASVHLLAEGFDLLWEKGDAINRYTYNGKVYDRADRGTPEFLSPDFDPIKVGSSSSMVQVAPQQEPIYLLNQTGGVVADVLSDVANLDRINLAVRMVEKDKKEAVATRKVRQADIAKGEATLARFDGLPTALALVRRLEGQGDAASKQGQRVDHLDRLATSLERAQRVVVALSPATAIHSFDTARLRAAHARYAQIIRYEGELRQRLPEVKRLGSLTVQEQNPRPLRSAADRLDRIDGYIRAMRAFRADFQQLDAAAKVAVPVADALRHKGGSYAKLSLLAERYEALRVEIARLEAEEARCLVEAAAVQVEWDALGVCPSCIRPFHPSTSCPDSPLSTARTSTSPTRAPRAGRGTTRPRSGRASVRSGSSLASMRPRPCWTAGTTSI